MICRLVGAAALEVCGMNLWVVDKVCGRGLQVRGGVLIVEAEIGLTFQMDSEIPHELHK